jgi:hypothetical protein
MEGQSATERGHGLGRAAKPAASTSLRPSQESGSNSGRQGYGRALPASPAGAPQRVGRRAVVE